MAPARSTCSADGRAAVLGRWVGSDDGEVRRRRPGRPRSRPRAGSPGWSTSRAGRRAARCRGGRARPGARPRAGRPGRRPSRRPGRPVTCRLITTSGTSRLSCSMRLLLIRGLHSRMPSTCLASACTSSSSTAGVLVGVGDEDVVVAAAGLALGRLDQRREERVGDVGHDQADVVRAAGDRAPGPPGWAGSRGCSAEASTRLRVSGLTRCGAENVRDTVEMCTPDARATSRIVAGTPASLLWRPSRRWGQLMQTVAPVSTAICCERFR